MYSTEEELEKSIQSLRDHLIEHRSLRSSDSWKHHPVILHIHSIPVLHYFVFVFRFLFVFVSRFTRSVHYGGVSWPIVL